MSKPTDKSPDEFDASEIDLEALGLESCSDCECTWERTFKLVNAFLLDASVCGADVCFEPRGDHVDVVLVGEEPDALFTFGADAYAHLRTHLRERAHAGVVEFEPAPGVCFEFFFDDRSPPHASVLKLRRDAEGRAFEVDLPSSIADELESIARNHDLSMSELVQKALGRGLELGGAGISSECVCPQLGNATERRILGIVLDEPTAHRLEAAARDSGHSTDALILRAIILTRECLSR